MSTENERRAFAIARQLQAQGQSAQSAARTAVGLLRTHDRSHAERGARAGCPYCQRQPSAVKWT